MFLHDRQPLPPIVSLRRYGDIAGLLPLLKFISDQREDSVELVVHKDFAGILEGVSYVTPVIWDGNPEDPLAACKQYGGINAQVAGIGLSSDMRTGDFAKFAWQKLGYVWRRHWTLVFDLRDPAREKKLADSVFKTDLPKILVKLDSVSSPYPLIEETWDRLRGEFSYIAELVNLDDVHAERPYDLIGLMDRAACLVSVDTLPLWLAKASKCPVVALVNPEPFLSSPPTGNVIARECYSEVFKEWDSIARAIHSTLFDPGGDGIALVYNEYVSTDPDTRRRENKARDTWPLLDARLVPFFGKRTSKDIGDLRSMAYVRDMIDCAFSTGPEKIVAITNLDIQFDPRLKEDIIKSCEQFGCWWAYRVESPEKSVTDHGGDLFAMTRKWWFVHRHLYPDMLIGFAWWDDMMVRMMRWSGCMERQRLYYHEAHPTALTTRPNTPGMKHNEVLAHEWLKHHHELNKKPEP